MTDLIFGIGALIVAVASLTITAIGLRRRTSVDDFAAERNVLQAQITGLERKTERMDRELQECKDVRDEFAREAEKLRISNFNLMSELYDLKRAFKREIEG